MKLYAEIVLPLPLEETFTYEVPEHLTQAARPGTAVEVIFNGRSAVGVLLRLFETLEPGLPYEPMPILQVVDPRPAVPEELIPFYRRAADYYFAPLGELLRMALPAGLPEPATVRYEPTALGRSFLAGLPVVGLESLTGSELKFHREHLAVIEKTPLTLEGWSRKAGRVSPKRLARALELGLVIEKRKEAAEKVAELKTVSYKPLRDPADPAVVQALKRTPARARVLAFIAEKGAATRSDVLSALPGSESTLKALCAQSFIEKIEGVRRRSPLPSHLLWRRDTPMPDLRLNREQDAAAGEIIGRLKPDNGLKPLASDLDKGLLQDKGLKPLALVDKPLAGAAGGTFLLYGVTGSG